MTFFTIIVRGLWRRPVRTGLTLVGIAVGIAAVVALVGISRGFEKSWGAGAKERGIDIVVSTLSSGLTPKPFSMAVRDRIASMPEVAATCSVFVDLTSVESASMMMVSAREWGGFSWNNLKLISGRMPKDAMEPAVVLGQTAAESLKKKNRRSSPARIQRTERRRHRGWRCPGGERLRRSLPPAVSGHHGQSGQD